MRNGDDRTNWTRACAKFRYCRPCSNIFAGCHHDFKRHYFAELDNPSVSAVERQPVYCSFNQAFSVIRQGYGKLRERDDWPTGRDDSDTIPIRRLESYGRSVVTPCGRIVVSSKLYSQLCNPGDEVQARFSLSVAVHHDKRDRALLTDEGDAERIFCSA